MANSILNSGSSTAVQTESTAVNSATTAICGTNTNAILLDNYKQAVTSYFSTSQKAKACDAVAQQSLMTSMATSFLKK